MMMKSIRLATLIMYIVYFSGNQIVIVINSFVTLRVPSSPYSLQKRDILQKGIYISMYVVEVYPCTLFKIFLSYLLHSFIIAVKVKSYP
jgi:hypothetical protein